MTTAPWNDSHIDLLKKLFADDGLSPRLIAQRMSEETGSLYTGGMISGKLQRLGLRRFGQAVHALHVCNKHGFFPRRSKSPPSDDTKVSVPPKPGRIMATTYYWSLR